MSKTLFVGNLPWSVTEEDLVRTVGDGFEVLSARIATDRDTGRSRGFGFVEVPDEVAQTTIDRLNGYELDGRQLTVNEAKPRTERSPRGYR